MNILTPSVSPEVAEAAESTRTERQARAEIADKAQWQRARENKRELDRLERAAGNPDPVFAYTDEQAVAEAAATEKQARGARLSAELNELIRKADAEFAEKVGKARGRYAGLLRSLSWGFQTERRNSEMIAFCEELFGAELGELIAWRIMAQGDPVFTAVGE